MFETVLPLFCSFVKTAIRGILDREKFVRGSHEQFGLYVPGGGPFAINFGQERKRSETRWVEWSRYRLNFW